MLEYHRAVSPTLLSPCPIVAGSSLPSVFSQYDTTTGTPGVTGTRSEIATASLAVGSSCSIRRLWSPEWASSAVTETSNGWFAGQSPPVGNPSHQ